MRDLLLLFDVVKGRPDLVLFCILVSLAGLPALGCSGQCEPQMRNDAVRGGPPTRMRANSGGSVLRFVSGSKSG